MSCSMYNLNYTPAMPLNDAHFGGFFVAPISIFLEDIGVACALTVRIIRPNNTPQASLPVHRRDAQTGGLLISGGGNAL
jgi:hypothetical protein